MRDKKIILERNPIIEQHICNAIKTRHRIKFRYDDELNYRTFEPYIIYKSTRQNYLVYGIQTYDSAKPLQGKAPRNFEIYYIQSLSTLDELFLPDIQFRSASFENNLGIVCAIDRV